MNSNLKTFIEIATKHAPNGSRTQRDLDILYEKMAIIPAQKMWRKRKTAVATEDVIPKKVEIETQTVANTNMDMDVDVDVEANPEDPEPVVEASELVPVKNSDSTSNSNGAYIILFVGLLVNIFFLVRML